METITLPARVQPLNDSDVTDGLVGHEARHAAVASLLGFTLKAVRCDWPEPRVLGRVEFDHSAETWDDVRLAEFFVTVAAGAMGTPGWPPPWPPSSSSPGSDEYALARIAEIIHLDETKYNALTAVARKTVEEPAVRAAESALSTFLEQTNLSGRQARDIAQIAFAMAFTELRTAHEEHQAHELVVASPRVDLIDEQEEREARQDPRYQATREQTYLNMMQVTKHDGSRALPSKALRITSGFWRGVL
jgi:hypothetical protein